MYECDKLYAFLDAIEEAIPYALATRGAATSKRGCRASNARSAPTGRVRNPIARRTAGHDKVRLKTFRRILKDSPRPGMRH